MECLSSPKAQPSKSFQGPHLPTAASSAENRADASLGYSEALNPFSEDVLAEAAEGAQAVQAVEGGESNNPFADEVKEAAWKRLETDAWPFSKACGMFGWFLSGFFGV